MIEPGGSAAHLRQSDFNEKNGDVVDQGVSLRMVQS